MALAESPANKRIKGLKIAHPAREGSGHAVIVEPSPRRVRVEFNGETVADSAHMRLVHEDGHLPIYYFPMSDVRMDLLHKTDHSTHCPYKGDASYWTVEVGDRRAENAVWGYENPLPAQPGLKGLVAFYWNRMDRWYEEDEEIFVHPRDPYKRVDAVRSSRRVEVVLGGESVAETTRAVFLFETGLPTRYYMPREDVRAELVSSDLETACPYKGTARYCSVRSGGRAYEDIVWFYPEPLVPKIKGLVAFYNEKVDAIRIDGEEVAKEATPWS